jgi:hypothetical protein
MRSATTQQGGFAVFEEGVTWCSMQQYVLNPACHTGAHVDTSGPARSRPQGRRRHRQDNMHSVSASTHQTTLSAKRRKPNSFAGRQTTITVLSEAGEGTDVIDLGCLPDKPFAYLNRSIAALCADGRTSASILSMLANCRVRLAPVRAIC